MADIANTLKNAGFLVKQAEGTRGIVVALTNRRVSMNEIMAVNGVEVTEEKMVNVMTRVDGKLVGGILIKP